MAVLLTVLLAFGVVGGVVALATPVVVEQGKQLVEDLPEATKRAESWLRRAQRDKTVRQLTNGKDVAGTLKAKVPEAMETVATLTPKMVGHLVELVSTIVLLVVLAAFLVYRPSALRARHPRHAPAELRGRLRRAVGTPRARAPGLGGRDRGGDVPDGLGHRPGSVPLRIQGWVLLGLLTFFGTFVPYVGAVSSSVPGLLVGLSQSPHHFFLALGVYVGVHVIEGYVVQPFVMRKAVEANPALQLFFQAVNWGACPGCGPDRRDAAPHRRTDRHHDSLDRGTAAQEAAPSDEPKAPKGEPAAPAVH